jgi:hypothetical protein
VSFWQAVPAAAFKLDIFVHSAVSFVPVPTVAFVAAVGENENVWPKVKPWAFAMALDWIKLGLGLCVTLHPEVQSLVVYIGLALEIVWLL